MNEKETQPSRRGKKIVGGLTATVALLGAGAAVKYGPDLASRYLLQESEIVAGVPGQVEDVSTTTTIINHTPTQVTRLTIEQCPADVEAAKEGRQTVSLNPEIGKIAAGCVVDQVMSSPVEIGSIVTLKGKLGERLRK